MIIRGLQSKSKMIALFIGMKEAFDSMNTARRHEEKGGEERAGGEM